MKKSEKYAYIGTAISALIILLIMFLVFLPGLKNEEDEGVMISFGEVTDGSGSEQFQSEPVTEPAPPVPVKEKPDELITQKDKSVVIPDTKKPEVVKPVETVTPPKTDPKTQPKPEPNREEQLKKEKEAEKKAEIIDYVFTERGNTGSGNTQSTNTSGNPSGQGASDGRNAWSLNGRNPLGGKLEVPVYNENQSAEIVLKIRVDQSGRVTSATFSRGRGATNELIRAAQQAALKTRFDPGNEVTEGTITYNFNLK